ncbi:uncharacterized mitochondrial protein AtMg00860-like [Dioscorea cayenensis subsp. rotundata]|uniref:Uncharacterized mitochondrial protein AtMg00860-like n=1 Tax=Dioscorea cayennensis subsp. rotundata TaxID=55577 RepID=A0AB40C374_DIOCR|nr:uncharacterized mitochondrial protein AtMg00860-like [Dioscorea cayenensis subsp. rotundata]
MDKGYVRESLSPCSVPVILVPKKDESWRMCVDYKAINNITVSKSLDDHIEHLCDVLDVLRKEQLYANLVKCTFCTKNVVSLGFVVSSQGVEVDEDKIKVVHEWETPQNVSQVRSFLGLAAFYHCFMKDFSTIAAPINELTKKEVPFKWGPAQEKAFQKLKDKLISAPLLALLDFGKTFEIECDASGVRHSSRKLMEVVRWATLVPRRQKNVWSTTSFCEK